MKNLLLLINASALASGKAPSHIQLVPLGNHVDGFGKHWTVTEEDVAVMVVASLARTTDYVVDYEHSTIKGGKAPAAGWVKNLENRGIEGLWGEVTWLPEAADFISKREYRYISPVVAGRQIDGVAHAAKFMHVALTNQPALANIQPLVSKEDLLTAEEERTEKMDSKLKLLLISSLGLGADATDDEVITTQEAANAAEGGAGSGVTSMESAPEVDGVLASALGLKPNCTLAEATAAALLISSQSAGSDEGDESLKRIAALEATNKEAAAELLVSSAMLEGKIPAAQKEPALTLALADPKGFEAFVSSASVVVPVGERQIAAVPPEAEASSEAATFVSAAMGISDEDRKKFGGTA